MSTTTIPVKDGGLNMLHVESQLKALKCSLLAKLVADLYKDKAWVKLMLYNLDSFRTAEQGISVLKTYIANVKKAKIPQAYRDLLQAWADITDNKRPRPNTLAEILNEPIFYNKFSMKENQNENSKFLFQMPPPWAKENFKTIGDLCNENAPGFIGMGEFKEAHIPRKHIHNPKDTDYYEIKKLIPQEWKDKILLNTAIEDANIRVKYTTFSGKWKIADVETLTCKDFYRTIHFRKIRSLYTNKKYLHWQGEISATQ